MLDKLTIEDFTPYLNQKFRINPESTEPLEVELLEVTELGSAAVRDCEPVRRSFSIVFGGPKDPSLPQGIYGIEHGKLGTLNLFLVPIGPALYQAVFT